MKSEAAKGSDKPERSAVSISSRNSSPPGVFMGFGVLGFGCLFFGVYGFRVWGLGFMGLGFGV